MDVFGIFFSILPAHGQVTPNTPGCKVHEVTVNFTSKPRHRCCGAIWCYQLIACRLQNLAIHPIFCLGICPIFSWSVCHTFRWPCIPSFLGCSTYFCWLFAISFLGCLPYLSLAVCHIFCWVFAPSFVDCLSHLLLTVCPNFCWLFVPLLLSKCPIFC